MDDGVEALVGFVGTHGDALELFEFAEEVFDQMTPFVHLRIESKRLSAARVLGDDDPGAAAYGLALSPPFAPWPWRWTLMMVASTMAYSISGSSEHASKSRTNISALTQSRYRLNT